MILQQTIDSVYQRMDIVEVVQDFVSLKGAGTNFKGLSPFNNERTPSFMVSREKQIFKCFSSGKGGNAVNFLMESQHWTYPEAIKYLCAKYGLEFQETEKTNEEAIQEHTRESLFLLTDIACQYFIQNLQIPGVYDFLLQRNIPNEIIQKFGIGYAPSTIAGLVSYLIQNGYSWEYAVQASLITYRDEKLYDFFRHRIMFPVRNIQGRIEGYGGRAIDWKKGDEFPKYLNSKDSFIYNKSNTVYGLFEGKAAIRENNMCYLSEGYTDVIGFHCIGIENIVAASGTSFTDIQARFIRRFTDKITVLFDGDNPGILAALRGIDIALAEGFSVKVCLLPDGQDPDDFRKGKTKEQVLEYINANSKDFIVFKLGMLLKNKDDFNEKATAITEIVTSIAKIVNPIQREVYLKECARIVDIEIDALRIMLNTAMSNDKEFFTLSLEDIQENNNNNRMYLLEQCEARILQYLLLYRNEVLQFKDIIGEMTNAGYVETFKIIEMTVYDKIKQDIIDDGLQFHNMHYNQILDKAISGDLSDFNSWQALLGSELLIVAQQLIETQQAVTLTSFEKDGLKTYEYIMKSKQENISNGLAETILFFKMLNVELIIAELMREENIDMQSVQEYMDFNNNLKVQLNLL